MPISWEQSHQNKINSLAVKDSKGNLVDYNNPYETGSPEATFFDELSFEGKKTLLNNYYAYSTLHYALKGQGLDWAKENVGKLLGMTPPSYTDPYWDAKQQGKGKVGNFDFFGFLLKAAPLILPVAAPALATTIGTALGATGAAAPIVGNSVISGTLSAAQGGSFAKGATQGAISAGASQLLKPVAAATSKAVGGGDLGKIAGTAVTSGIKAGVQGKDVLTGAALGGLSSAVDVGLAPIKTAATDAFGGDTVGKVASGLLTGAAKNAIMEEAVRPLKNDAIEKAKAAAEAKRAELIAKRKEEIIAAYKAKMEAQKAAQAQAATQAQPATQTSAAPQSQLDALAALKSLSTGQTQPAQKAKQQQQQTFDDILVDRSRYASLRNPLLRKNALGNPFMPTVGKT